MKSLLQKILKFFARKILKKYQPEIIGITGSVGKTSAKEAIFSVLSAKFNVQSTEGNYNNEIGLPLTVISKKTAGKNIFGWIAIFFHALVLIWRKSKNYPEILILEMAVDKPGDMDYLLDFIKLRIGVLTRIGPVHLESFKRQGAILEEKGKLIKKLPQNGFAILNYDYKDVLGLCDSTNAKCITYGMEDGSDVLAKNILVGKSQTSFSLEYKDKKMPVIILNSIGKVQIYAVLVGICAGLVKGMELLEIKEALINYRAPKGRGELLKGIKNTTIIDETYNASPQSVEAALENLKNIAGKERAIAVLGDMLELGSISRQAHLDIGAKVRESEIDYLFTVGVRAKDIAKGAEEAGMHKDKIYSFDNNSDLGKFLQEKMEEGDTVLVKGSNAMKMSEVVDEVKLI
ncbi:hypothetical protein L6259_03540 [Candidatus Parcubacteria bacterium]|nr:hypothetical protein [Patescibacteria group bacterium]MCG2694308.1 hypothetical protein [Candidatus Parcubacteria bacterium]